MRSLRPWLSLLCTLALAACAYAKPNPTPPNYIRNGPGDPYLSRLGGPNSGEIFRYPPEPPGFYVHEVNPYLWRGALLTLGMAPLIIADPFGGVIVTDWYSLDVSRDERLKVSAFILGYALRSDAVRVSVFRQVYRNGRWLNAPAGTAVEADLKNEVLQRARALQATGR